jgi:hypothetical protein
MMGGLFGTSMDDPRTMGLFQLAAGLMSAPRMGQGLSQGLLAYGDTMSRAKQQQSLDELRKMQMQQAQMQMEQQRQQQEQANRDRTLTQQQYSPLPGPTQDGGPLARQFDPRSLLGQGGSMDAVTQMLQLETAMKKPVLPPLKLGAGEKALDPLTYKTLAENPKEKDEPSGVREYQFARAQGYKGTYEQWDQMQRKTSATRVTVPVNVNTAKQFSATLAEEVAKQASGSHAQARAAVGSIDTAQRLKAAVDSGKLVAGPGASVRVFGLQLGQMLGVGGKNSAETLANTRTAIQGMAQAELDAAQQMKGQGQITEAERDIIRRAASGSVDALTAPEIRLLADSLEKVGRNKIRAHQRNLQGLKSIEGSGPLVPMLEMQEPELYQSPASSAGGNGWSIRQK